RGAAVGAWCRRQNRFPLARPPQPVPQATAVRAVRQRSATPQRGFFLNEAMVAILIFALGILGLVAMGGTAVSSQSDAQYRTEASSLADAIAGEIALNINRSSPATKAASVAAFVHQPNPPPTDVPFPCVFNGSALTN